MHSRDKDVYKLVSPHDFLYPTAAVNYADKCWFCVPFVFQGVSDFCSDILFKLQQKVDD